MAMTTETRNFLATNRLTHYYSVLHTTFLGFIAIAAIIHFSTDIHKLMMSLLILSVTAYGVLAGNTALADVKNLGAGTDEELAKTNFGKGIEKRNMGTLQLASGSLIALSGFAEIYTVMLR